MLKPYKILQQEYSQYKNVKMKIKQLADKGEIIPITKGLYETNISVNPFYLANPIYNPSYISFQTALSYYGLIPERTYNITNATFGKNKHKKYINKFAIYLYRDVPKQVFAFGTTINQENEYMYCLATREKALLDMLYITSPLNSQKNLLIYLEEDLRFRMDALDSFDIDFINEITPLYHSTNINLFQKFINKYMRNNDKQ